MNKKELQILDYIMSLSVLTAVRSGVRIEEIRKAYDESFGVKK